VNVFETFSTTLCLSISLLLSFTSWPEIRMEIQHVPPSGQDYSFSVYSVISTKKLRDCTIIA